MKIDFPEEKNGGLFQGESFKLAAFNVLDIEKSVLYHFENVFKIYRLKRVRVDEFFWAI